MRRSTRKRAYFTLMGTCLVLILLAWNVVRLWSTTAAVVMSVVAAVIPPVAVFVGEPRRSRRLPGLIRRRARGASQLIFGFAPM